MVGVTFKNSSGSAIYGKLMSEIESYRKSYGNHAEGIITATDCNPPSLLTHYPAR